MPEAEQKLEDMGWEFISDVNAIRRNEKKPPLTEAGENVMWRLLNEEGGVREHLLEAIRNDTVQMIMTPVGGGQGMYTAASKAICINPDSLEEAARRPEVAYNLNFTLAHEARHARDGLEIVEVTEGLRGAVIAKAQDPVLPHDYTEIVAEYLRRDRVLEERAETAGLNAHVSKVQADMGGEATLRDVYNRSPKDMAPYVDITPGSHLFAKDEYAYKPGLVVLEDGIHLDADHPHTLEAMGRYFYDAQNYAWKQGLKGALDVINSAESNHVAEKDPRFPPQIDFASLGVGPAPDSLTHGMMQQVVDSSLPKPNQPISPDHAYFSFLQDKLPGVSEDHVAHAMLEAKRGGLTDPSRVVAEQVGQDEHGKIWIGGTRGERIEVDPAQAQPLIKTTQGLDTHSFEQSQRQQEEAAQEKNICRLM